MPTPGTSARLEVLVGNASHRHNDGPTNPQAMPTHRLAEGKLVMFLAIDRVSKFTVVQFHKTQAKRKAQRSCAISSIPSRMPCILC